MHYKSFFLVEPSEERILLTPEGLLSLRSSAEACDFLRSNYENGEVAPTNKGLQAVRPQSYGVRAYTTINSMCVCLPEDTKKVR